MAETKDPIFFGESSQGGEEVKTLWALESYFVSLTQQIPREFIKDMAKLLMSSFIEKGFKKLSMQKLWLITSQNTSVFKGT